MSAAAPGLLAEPLARLGAKVTGIDASPEVIAVARKHAQRMGLEIDYRAGDVHELEGKFDLITCMEVIEHVAEPSAVPEGACEASRAGRAADPVHSQRDGPGRSC